ncbi:DNA dC-_dU-editing enzyme APOBEC-3-like [Dipodomys spectabilis]|uniref:DNA dC->dU-editing enzyme APOBEC-3-like n=1 Tax=Dipodomys spectabilis TaxID=105255 RepID=UPI001C549732|nr:DNA dC->dU-editing enzyme APOBEC-3-like [Dipodomys spectabilis]
MQLQRQRPRAGLGPSCLGCLYPSTQIRDPMFTLSQGSFYFHFQNLLYANGRHTTFLCCRVEREQEGLIITRVFKNQVGIHAELCFLHWFHDEEFFPGEDYQLTWYMSWSPCPNCAEQVAQFLAAHRNVSLTIFIARLYYHWLPQFQQGLRRLCQEGAQVEVMSYQEFEDCCEEFVKKSFRPWKGLYTNYKQQEGTLRRILGSTVSLLKEETFLFQFNNRHRVPRHCGQHRPRRRTYLCYLLARPGDTTAPTKGCLQNKKGHHAEIRFIERIRSMGLDPSQDYQITCYLTWSPCLDCAFKLAKLKKDFPRLTLRIFTSRLYFHWIRKFQKGLHQLWLSGVLVAIMGLQEFTDCWNNFVNHQQRSFAPWEKLDAYSKNIRERLGRILRSWGCGPTPSSGGDSR